MLINNHFNPIYNPNFSANLIISGNQLLLSDKQITQLSQMIKPLGEKDDVVEVNISSDIIDWVEINSLNHPKKFLSGYKMCVNTSIKGTENQDLSTADIQQRFWDNYAEFSPFGVLKSWVQSVKKKSIFNVKKININPSLYNLSNEGWFNGVSIKTPDTPPVKMKVDLDKCQNILDIKIYGGIGYKQILHDAGKENSATISAESIIESLELGEKEENLRAKIQVADKYNGNIKKTHSQTKERYSDGDGVYTQERLAIHKRILDQIFANFDEAKPKEGNQPTFIMLGGRGGSGKTKFGKNGVAKVYDKQNYIVLNSDEIKKQLPEYKGFNSFEVHEESWDILNRALKLSIEKGLNVVLDGTLSDFNSNENILKQFSDAGYNIQMYFMYLGREKAAKRALLRFDYNDRYVPLDVLLNMKNNEQNFDKLKEYASKWAFYSNDVELGNEPILVNFETPDLLELLLQNCKLD